MSRSNLIDPALAALAERLNAEHRYLYVGLRCACQAADTEPDWEHRIEPRDHLGHLLTVAVREHAQKMDLHYDRDHHAETRAATRAAEREAAGLFPLVAAGGTQ